MPTTYRQPLWPTSHFRFQTLTGGRNPLLGKDPVVYEFGPREINVNDSLNNYDSMKSLKLVSGFTAIVLLVRRIRLLRQRR